MFLNASLILLSVRAWMLSSDEKARSNLDERIAQLEAIQPSFASRHMAFKASFVHKTALNSDKCLRGV